MDWDYNICKVHLYIITYVNDALKRFHHSNLLKPQDHPYPHTKPKYGSKEKFAESVESSPLLSKEEKNSSNKSPELLSAMREQ